MARKPLGERVQAVEVEIKHFGKICSSLQSEIKEHNVELKKVTNDIAHIRENVASANERLNSFMDRFDSIDEQLAAVTDVVSNIKGHAKLSGRDKAAIIVSLVSGIVSIVVVLIKVMP